MEEYAFAKFGIGLLKRKVLLKVDLTKAETTSLSLASGVGYRFGSRGLFLNTRPGPALFIPAKEGKRHFLCGLGMGRRF